jgi:hypothetical protein
VKVSVTLPPIRSLCIQLLLLAALLCLPPTMQAAQIEETRGQYALSSGEPQAADPDNGVNSETKNSPADSGSSQSDSFNRQPHANKGGSQFSPLELAKQANNPTAPLAQIQFRDIYVPTAKPQNGALNSFQFQPVIPIGPFERFPITQLMKITMPFVSTVPEPTNATGMGDLTVFDLVTVKQSWGTWGVGPILVFPAATNEALGAGKYQAGPSAGAMVTGIENLVAGAILQNPISFAGSSNRQSVNQLIVSPTLTYNLKGGWFFGLSDYNWTFDWKAGGAPVIPAGIQVGKLIRIGKQPISFSVEAGRVLARPANTPNPGWIFGFEITPLFNLHLGGGKKIHLRGDGEY